MTAEQERAADVIARHVRAALEAALAELGGGMVTAYAGVVDYLDQEGMPAWATIYGERQHPARTLGLLRWQTIAVEEQARAYLAPDDD